MDKFDTHGGHYEPQGSMRVNAGGSHDENPNGGVQVGVDPEGTPNLLEEGEPVYNDYVYSDNIYADGGVLEKHNIPSKYSGKLYSEIADSFVDEVAEIPLDPIANNGLNAMLVRLAESQEEQKSIKEQKDLEDELSKLSPEELDELEQMLSEQEMVQQQENPEAAVPEMVQEPIENQGAMYQNPEQQPMMKCGGNMRRMYFPGGTLLKRIGEVYDKVNESAVGHRILQELGMEQKTITLPGGEVVPVTGGAGAVAAIATPAELAPIRGMRAAKNATAVGKAMDAAYEAEKAAEVEKAMEAAYETGKTAAKATKAAKKAKTAKESEEFVKKGMKGWGNAFWDPSWAGRRLWHDMPTKGFWPTAGKVALEIPVSVGNSVMAAPAWNLAGKVVNQAAKTVDAKTNASTQSDYSSAKQADPFASWGYYNGGRVNRYDGITPAPNPMRQQRVVGPYQGFNNYGWGYTTGFPTADHAYDYQIYNPNIDYKWYYGPFYNDGTGSATGTNSGTTTTVTKSGRGRGTSSRYPLYQMSEEELNAIEAEADRGLQRGYERFPLVTRLNSIIPGLGRKDENGETIMYGRPAEKGLAQANLGIIPTPKRTTLNSVVASHAKPAKTSEVSDTGMLPTWPRYAGAVISGLLGLYNAFQEPDKYTIPSYTPVLPQGRMHLIDPVYNPIDQNQLVNDVLASSAGTTRAINNSGLGAATQATLLAQDYNTGRNLETALTQAREANNQRLNQVIAQRNQNAGTLGNFNYGQSRDRAQILNDAAVRNLQNDILRQRLNYEAEGQKYAAIQQQIDSVAQALSDIGRENAAMNMINGDEAYAYALSRLFDPYYKGHITKCGGPTKKTKK